MAHHAELACGHGGPQLSLPLQHPTRYATGSPLQGLHTTTRTCKALRLPACTLTSATLAVYQLQLRAVVPTNL